MADAPQPEPIIALLPWLRVEETATVAQMQLVPFPSRAEANQLDGLEDRLDSILKHYQDNQGNPIKQCAVVVRSDRKPNWGLRPEDVPTVGTAASLSFLAAASNNEYYRDFGHYVNSSHFQMHLLSGVQGGSATRTTIQVRRRDRPLPKSAPERIIRMPEQIGLSNDVKIDAAFLSALDGVSNGSPESPLFRRIRTASRFFLLANSDDDFYNEETELVLLGAAFEMLLNADGAYCVSSKFGDLLEEFQTTTVKQAREVRSGITIDPKYESAQDEWATHRKWIEELHQLRSTIIHGDNPKKRGWGWSLHEHLVMGAFVFPLAVKARLQCGGLYKLTQEDEIRCRAVDQILPRRNWEVHVDERGNTATVWDQAIIDASQNSIIERALRTAPPQDQGNRGH